MAQKGRRGPRQDQTNISDGAHPSAGSAGAKRFGEINADRNAKREIKKDQNVISLHCPTA